MRIAIAALLTLLILCAACAQQDSPSISTEPVPFDRVITVEAGEFITLGVSAFDPDGDPIQLTFSLPLDQTGQWQTTINDVGTHDVTVTANDGQLTTTKHIRIVVTQKNRPPKIMPINDVTIRVGDTIRFEPEVNDPDGDEVTLNYSGWMQSNQKTAVAEDEGAQIVTIIASDGRLEHQRTVTITVLPPNHAPVLEPLPSLTVFEGDTIRINPRATDPEGDEITFTYSGFMESNVYTTTYEDAGTQEVIVTASDGYRSDMKKIVIAVKDRPRAPEIVLE